MPGWIYRFCAAGIALVAFLATSCLYRYGDRELYEQILSGYGIVPFQFPFVDISALLAVWECTRQGVDVIVSDPCDVLRRGYSSSPLWLTGAWIPLGVKDTTAVGWVLDLVFLLSLCLLPPPRRLLELILVVAATLSTMVVFGLERANLDILIFLLALATGLLTECSLLLRLFGYCLGLTAALIKYYPIMVLVVVFRERRVIFCLVSVAVVILLTAFWGVYHGEIARGAPNIASGRYDTDLFAAKNLPFMIGMLVEHLAEPSPHAGLMGTITATALYAMLVGICVAISRRLLLPAELRTLLASLPCLDRVLLVIGSAVIVGCFFAGQSIGYRGVFLLFVIPGLLAVSRTGRLRRLGRGTSIVIVLVMWGECFRLALHAAVEQSGALAGIFGGLQLEFWLLRELCWWWIVSVMLAVCVDFLQDSPVFRGFSSRPDHRAIRAS